MEIPRHTRHLVRHTHTERIPETEAYRISVATFCEYSRTDYVMAPALRRWPSDTRDLSIDLYNVDCTDCQQAYSTTRRSQKPTAG